MAEFNATITLKYEVSPGLCIFRIAPNGWELPPFQAGQFAVLGLPGTAERSPFSEQEDAPADPSKWILRAYSIASGSTSRDYVEFYITMVTSGALTPRLFHLNVGAKVWLGPKITGLFTLNQVPEDAHVLMISTGTGLAPYMSMLRTHLVCGGERQFAVLHGARHSWDLGYQSELSLLQHLCGNFSYLPIISRPQKEVVEWKGNVGYVQDLWTRKLIHEKWKKPPTPDNCHIFLCGHPGMIETCVPLLEKEGYREHTRKEPGQIHVERFW